MRVEGGKKKGGIIVASKNGRIKSWVAIKSLLSWLFNNQVINQSPFLCSIGKQ